jgi:Flp pilus assembly pilin Flp
LHFLRRFLRSEDGQDLVEYTLLIAFLALSSAALFSSVGSSTSTIWNSAENVLSSSSGTTGPSASQGDGHGGGH